ncbi:MAG: undecaprenyl-diphosphate phosphatase [Nitrososphaeria archaeon]
MISVWQAILLAVVQGITEWLPISSSGHLVIFQEFLDIQASVGFDVMLHFGTFLSVLAYMRKDVIAIFRAVIVRGEDSRLAAYMLIGSIPLAVVGFPFKMFFESLFSSTAAVGLALIVNGLVLFMVKYAIGYRKLRLADSLLVGIAQAFSIIPGISRSGSTISAAMIRGVDKEIAYKYSFLLSMIAILGATIFKFGDIDFAQESLSTIFAATTVSAIVGFMALKATSVLVLKGKFHKFGYYCLALGIMVTFVSLLAHA